MKRKDIIRQYYENWQDERNGAALYLAISELEVEEVPESMDGRSFFFGTTAILTSASLCLAGLFGLGAGITPIFHATISG
jgi:hypothetical protein